MEVEMLIDGQGEFEVRAEAQRRKHLHPEIVFWAIIDAQWDGAMVQFVETTGQCPVVGEWDHGRVLVKNRHGAMWTMGADEFDAEYMAR